MMAGKFRTIFAPTLFAGATLLAGLTALTATAAHADETTVERKFEEFDKIRLMGKFAGQIVVGEGSQLIATGEGDVDERIETELVGDELQIKLTKKKQKRDTVFLIIHTKELEQFIVEGAGEFDIEGIKSDDFELRLPGAAKITMNGTCEDLSIIIAGAAHVDGENLKCKTGNVRISGTGTISVFTSEEIDARVSGLGKITIFGNPQEIDQHISGLGKIKLQ